VYTREENTDWIPAARGEFKKHEEVRTEIFKEPRNVRCVKLILLSGFNRDPYAELAEIELLPAEK